MEETCSPSQPSNQLLTASQQRDRQESALRKEFGDSVSKSRQDILAGESRVVAERSASCGCEFGKVIGSDAKSLTIMVTSSSDLR
ncbi:MAG: hypothetical protein FD138_3533 [Planctomycetota bacterium]|nr:MAG: hypothetical protein FD138_3533 [Planctomycetota bacterium]